MWLQLSFLNTLIREGKAKEKVSRTIRFTIVITHQWEDSRPVSERCCYVIGVQVVASFSTPHL